MAEYEPTDEKTVNVFAFPKDKTDAILEALKPLLGVDEEMAAAGLGTACNLTAPTPSSYDWVCDDQVAVLPE